MKKNSKKRNAAVAVCMCLMLSGCSGSTTPAEETKTAETIVTETAVGNAEPVETEAEIEIDTVTMEDIVNANKNDTLMSQFGSFQVTLTDEIETLVTYVGDEGIAYIGWPDDDYGELYVDNELVYSHDGDIYRGQMYVGTEPEMFYTDNVLFSNLSTFEEIKSFEEKDGLLYVITEQGPEYTEIFMTERNYGYDEGGYLHIEYILDAETLAEQAVIEKEIKTDGTERIIGSATVEYSVEIPERAQDTYEHSIKEGDMRTITVIADPDTDNEKEYVGTVLKGDGIAIYHPNGDPELYADRACTEILTNVDLNEDITVYVLTKEE